MADQPAPTPILTAQPIVYAGSYVSLITRLDVRYTGTVTLATDEETLVLSNVRSHGTEGRAGLKGKTEILPVDQVFDSVSFRKQEILRISIESSTAPTNVPDDPAIIAATPRAMPGPLPAPPVIQPPVSLSIAASARSGGNTNGLINPLALPPTPQQLAMAYSPLLPFPMYGPLQAGLNRAHFEQTHGLDDKKRPSAKPRTKSRRSAYGIFPVSQQGTNESGEEPNNPIRPTAPVHLGALQSEQDSTSKTDRPPALQDSISKTPSLPLHDSASDGEGAASLSQNFTPPPTQDCEPPDERLRKAVEALKGNPTRGLRAVAREFGVARSTLSRHVHKPAMSTKRGAPTTLSEETEKKLVDFVLEMARQGRPLSKKELLEKAGQLAAVVENKTFKNKVPTGSFWRRFKKRRLDGLIEVRKRHESPDADRIREEQFHKVVDIAKKELGAKCTPGQNREVGDTPRVQDQDVSSPHPEVVGGEDHVEESSSTLITPGASAHVDILAAAAALAASNPAMAALSKGLVAQSSLHRSAVSTAPTAPPASNGTETPKPVAETPPPHAPIPQHPHPLMASHDTIAAVLALAAAGRASNPESIVQPQSLTSVSVPTSTPLSVSPTAVLQVSTSASSALSRTVPQSSSAPPVPTVQPASRMQPVEDVTPPSSVAV
eukprot:Rmarinus@m.12680